MPIWTISAQLGAGGPEIATALAAEAGVPLHDRNALAALANALEPRLAAEDVTELEEWVPGRLNRLALSAAMASGSADAVQELQLRRTLPDLGRAVLREAARGPGVVLADAAFIALAEHPGAIHVRIRAPFEWRVAEVRRRDLVGRDEAKRLVRHDDHLRRSWVRALYHADLDDPARFGLVLDSSRLSRRRIVETLLAAGGSCASSAGNQRDEIDVYVK